MVTRLPDPSEAAFQRDVIDGLRTFGYLATSIRRSDRVTIGDVGLPDVIAVHRTSGWLSFIELKVGTNTATPAQREWLAALARHADFAGVVTPGTWRESTLALHARAAGVKRSGR